jgi:hypothetical protein
MSTTTTPLGKLEALEAAAFAGENVTPKQLSDARVAVDLEAITAAGEQHRAEEAAATQRAERRAAAKAAAVERLSTVSPEVLASKLNAVVDALDDLVAAIETHNSEVVAVGRALSAAGLPTDADTNAPHFDADYHALTEHHQVIGATVAGVWHTSESAATWIAPAVHDVAVRNGKLPLRYGRSLAKILEAGISRSDYPAPVTAALAERQAAQAA